MNNKASIFVISCCIQCTLFAPSSVGQKLRLVDPMAVQVNGDPSRAVQTVSLPSRIPQKQCDVVILGGELGGSAAALEAASKGVRVCLTEPTLWIGGQMTAEGVSAFDDNQWTETTGSSRKFQYLRQKIRKHYAPLLRDGIRADTTLNPGACWVSYECSEASVDHDVLLAMLAPYIKSGALVLLTRSAPIVAEHKGRRLKSAIVYNFETHQVLRLNGSVFIDATALGEFLPMAKAEYVTGAEAQGQTGEPDASLKADPDAAQSFTYTFVLGQRQSPLYVEKPAKYGSYRSHFSFSSTDADGKTLSYSMYKQLPNTPGSFWSYRRLIAKDQFKPGIFASDLSMINWDSNDVCDNDLLSLDPDKQAKAMQYGKQVAMSFAWWLQHEAPHDDAQGRGFPEIYLDRLAMGSTDGLSQFPYIREARRIKAMRTIREQDVVTENARAKWFSDTVGIGQYPIDIHACGTVASMPNAKPFQIPLGSLISSNVDNLLAASKNIGTTHITNGAYRVHSTEWSIGSAAGTVAAAAVKKHLQIKQIESNPFRLHEIQLELILSGQPLVWFDDVLINSPLFESAQLATALGLIEVPDNSLSFHSESFMEGRDVVHALHRLFIEGVLVMDFSLPEDALRKPVEWERLRQFGLATGKRHGCINRGDFASWIIALYRANNSSRS